MKTEQSKTLFRGKKSNQQISSVLFSLSALLCSIHSFNGPFSIHWLFAVIPIPLVVVWAVANMLDPDSDPSHCGQGYSLLATYWILEGPRIFVIVVGEKKKSF